MDGIYEAQLDLERQTLMAEVRIGDQAALFFESELGQYIRGLAFQEIIEFRFKLEEADPFDCNGVMKLQKEVLARYLALQWLENAIISGQQAADSLDQMERTD